jgi:RNA polymerase sigma factor (sigma-70 family)
MGDRTSRSSREAEWARLMRAAMAGDAQAYRDVLAAMTPHLRAMARRRCEQFGVSTSEAEDVVQEVLLTIHLKRASWDPDRAIGPWLSTIVRNKLIDILRRRGRQAGIPIEDVIGSIEVEDASDPNARLDAQTILRNLKDPQLTIVRSISMEGASVRETASLLNMSEVAVRVSLHRALKALSARYRKSHEDN